MVFCNIDKKQTNKPCNQTNAVFLPKGEKKKNRILSDLQRPVMIMIRTKKKKKMHVKIFLSFWDQEYKSI